MRKIGSVMINIFVSRSTWFPPGLKTHLPELYVELDRLGLTPTTLGTSVAPIQTPFDEIRALMGQSRCAIILGTHHLIADDVRLKGQPAGKMILPTEWNHIEAATALVLDLPTLVLLQTNVSARGLFERGAANVFVHECDLRFKNWVRKVVPALEALRNRVAP